jgi:ribosome-binding protein aMBF1 (putative translation factor)
MKKANTAVGSSFRDLWNDENLIDDDARARIVFEVALIGKLIEAREKSGITQQQLSEMSGLTQSAIARLENMKVMPKIDTFCKLLKPLGYKLAIVPDDLHHKTA